MTVKIKKAVLLIIITMVIALFSVITIVNSEKEAYAGIFVLTYSNEKTGNSQKYISIKTDDDKRNYYDEEIYNLRRYDEYKQRIYVEAADVNEVVYIEYDRVALNSELDTLEYSNGKITSERTVLDENVRIEVEDLIDTGNTGEKYKYYFEISTDCICAWIFRIYYYIPGDAENSIFKGNDILYCTKIDNVAPTATLSNKIYGSNMVKYTYKFNDPLKDTASSGISKIITYKKASGSSAYEVYDERTGNNCSADSAVISLERTNAEYFLEVVDYVGNTTGKMKIAEFTSVSYDVAFESNVDIALNELLEGKYSQALTNEFTDSYYEYMTVTRDETATEEDKEKAKNELRVVYDKYRTAKNNAAEGKVNCSIEIINKEFIPDLTVKDYETALSFLPYGEMSEMTLTLAKYAYKDVKDTKSEVLKQTEFENAKEVYCVTVRLADTNGSKISKQFSAPMVLKFAYDKENPVSAVQAVYNSYGEVTYHKCTVVQYIDGSIAVNVPYTSGVVNIFVGAEEKNKDLYWLFALTAIPLIAGGILLAYAFKKINKIKKASLEKSNEKAEEKETDNLNSSDEQPKPAPNKSKKKLKKKK